MNDGARTQAQVEHDDFGVSTIRELIELLRESDISEIQIERGTSRLHIKRGLTATTSVSSAAAVVVAAPATPVATTPSNTPDNDMLLPGQSAVTAPMVGTFYTAPSPKEKAYVEDGDIIQPGDRVGIIEAMKMMNEIESEVSGRVVRILVKNAQPVEYGQALMIVEPI